MDGDYDVIVLGAGPVGENVADRVARGGLSAALVESELLGGECSYWACIPSKVLLRPGAALRAARAVPGAAEAVTGELDVGPVLRRRDEFTSRWNDSGQVQWAESQGIAVLRGRGQLEGTRAVRITPTEQGEPGEPYIVTAKHAVVVCTGSDPAMPPVPGLEDAHPWTNREATSAEAPPGRLAIIGGGAVGCELAQAWTDLGSEVTLIERSDRLLPAAEPFAGGMVASALEQSGVRVLVRTGVQRVRPDSTSDTGAGHILTVRPVPGDDTSGPSARPDGQRAPLPEETELTVDTVLVSTGRTPRTRDLGLTSIGLADGNWLVVDDSGRVHGVDGDWLYAAGDVTGQALLTHMGKYAARVTGDSIVSRARGAHAHPVAWSPYAASALHAGVTSVVFTDPEVASVGLTEQAAREQGISVRTLEQDIAVAGSSVIAEHYTGKVKIVLDDARQVIVGFTAVGPGAAELLHAATIAVVGEVPLSRLWHAVPAFPSVSEFWLRLLEGLGL